MKEGRVEIIESTATFSLSAKDWDMFMDLVEDLPKPNENLKKAIAEYKKLKAQPAS